jgi:hypothetical protein
MLKNAKVLNVNLHWEGSNSLSRQPLILKQKKAFIEIFFAFLVGLYAKKVRC